MQHSWLHLLLQRSLDGLLSDERVFGSLVAMRQAVVALYKNSQEERDVSGIVPNLRRCGQNENTQILNTIFPVLCGAQASISCAVRASFKGRTLPMTITSGPPNLWIRAAFMLLPPAQPCDVANTFTVVQNCSYMSGAIRLAEAIDCCGMLGLHTANSDCQIPMS